MSDHRLHVEIVTPYELFFDEEVDMAVVTCKDGEIGIMPGHTPVMAALTPGEIRIKQGDETRIAVATNGYAEIGHDLILIVVNAAEWVQNIDVRRAEHALQRAEARIKDPAVSAQEKTHARHGMLRAKARLKAAKRYGVS